jgi:SAM-dependent methyltransferase
LALDQKTYWNITTTLETQRPPEHPVCRYFSRQRWSFVRRYIDLEAINSVLDVGCGRGMASGHLDSPTRSLTGVDISLGQIRANTVSRLKLINSTGESLPFRDRAFDLVTCWELLHHADNPGQVVEEMIRVSGGWLVIFEPNLMNPAQYAFAALMPGERGSFRLRNHVIDDALRRNDFEILTFQHVGWIFPNRTPMWLFHLLRHLPFQLPIFGISRLWIARRTSP